MRARRSSWLPWPDTAWGPLQHLDVGAHQAIQQATHGTLMAGDDAGRQDHGVTGREAQAAKRRGLVPIDGRQAGERGDPLAPCVPVQTSTTLPGAEPLLDRPKP